VAVDQQLTEQLVAALRAYHDDDECLYGAEPPAGWANCGDPGCRYCESHALLAVAELRRVIDLNQPFSESLSGLNSTAAAWNMTPTQLAGALIMSMKHDGPGAEVDQ